MPSIRSGQASAWPTPGVVAKAVGLERAVEASAFGEVGRAEADHVAGGELQPRSSERVVGADIVHDVPERAKLLVPISARPCGAVEMPHRVRGDLVAVAVKIVHIVYAPANLIGRAAETDAGIAAALMRTLVDVALAVGDEIDPADEEGEVNAVAVAVHLGGKIGEFLPALELGAVVERHHDELRWAVDARVHRHGVRQQQSQRGNECPRGQFSPPTESDSESVLSDSRLRIMSVRTVCLRRVRNSRRCDTKGTPGRRSFATVIGTARAIRSSATG